MRLRLEALAPLIAGCATFLVPSPCDQRACAPFACSANGYCLEDCGDDDECANGFVCDWDRSCIEACDAGDCEEGYGCDRTTNECNEWCVEDRDCAAGYHCCSVGENCTDDGFRSECIPRPD